MRDRSPTTPQDWHLYRPTFQNIIVSVVLEPIAASGVVIQDVFQTKIEYAYWHNGRDSATQAFLLLAIYDLAF